MRYVVTGAAGFIGSHLAAALLARAVPVIGVDNFSPYYDRALKEANVRSLASLPGFTLERSDLATDPLESLLEPGDVVFHVAAQPGVRTSWSAFDAYVSANIVGTQRLLAACLRRHVQRVVYSSSSSVYGNSATYPTAETAPTRPESPYGATKRAGEDLVDIYRRRDGFDAVMLRYFTVYGPRQRPDMAVFRLIDAALGGGTFSLYGDGSQRRDFTYVGDVVRANLLAADVPQAPEVPLNIAGGASVRMAELIELVSKACGRAPRVITGPGLPGDVQRTGASTELAARVLGWRPAVGLADGLVQQVVWQRQLPLGGDLATG
jgi:UDP-glucuronate 4-epimerase